MDQFKIGEIVVSTAGHDFGKWYVIILIEDEYVYLVDGKNRTLNHPKKKKKKHSKVLNKFDHFLADKMENGTVKNEEIKSTIKLLQSRNSSKEVE